MKLRENFDTDAMEYNLFWDETDGNKTRTSAYLGNRQVAKVHQVYQRAVTTLWLGQRLSMNENDNY